MVPPPWRGAGRFVAWLSTSVNNYSKAGSCLWAAAPVPGVLMMSVFFRNLLSTDLEAGSQRHKHTHSITHTQTHTLNHSLTHSLTPSLPHSPSHSVRFTSIIIIIMCQRCLPATGHAERIQKMCGCARKSAEHYFGQRKYGERTIVLIVCRKAGKARPFRMCVKHVWCWICQAHQQFVPHIDVWGFCSPHWLDLV